MMGYLATRKARRSFAKRGGLFVVLIACACVSQGCIFVAASRYTGSQAVGTDGTTHFSRRSVAHLDLTGLRMDIQIQNVRRRWTQAGIILPLIPVPPLRGLKPPLVVWIDMTPAEGPVEFDPGRVYLRVGGDDKRLGVSGYHGPGIARTNYFAMNPYQYGCGFPEHPQKVADSKARKQGRRPYYLYSECFNCRDAPAPLVPNGVPLVINGPACFVLLFDTSPSPGNSFALAIEGVQASGAPLTIPEILFEKGSDWEWDWAG